MNRGKMVSPYDCENGTKVVNARGREGTILINSEGVFVVWDDMPKPVLVTPWFLRNFTLYLIK